MSHRLSIIDALIFDGENDELFESPVHIEDGEIVGMDGRPSHDARVIEAGGRLLAPGLIDAHFHAYGSSLDLFELETTLLSYLTAKAMRRLGSTLRRGFTTVRDVAGGDIGLANAIEQGIIEGPRYLFVGRALTQTGGHGDPRPGYSTLQCCIDGHMAEIVDGVDDLRRAVRDRFRTGAHAIKIMTSGGVVSPTDPILTPQYSAEEVQAVCDEASRRGSYVAAHAYSPEAIEHSVANGVRTIEHGNLLDSRTAKLMVEHGAFLVPTLIAYHAMRRRGAELGLPPVSQAKNREVLDAGIRSLETARKAGVPVGLGTDLMGDLEDDQLTEFEIRSEMETVADMLRSATSVNADIIGRGDLGRIAVGNPADLVLFAGNPFDEPSVLWKPDREVVHAGRRLDK